LKKSVSIKLFPSNLENSALIRKLSAQSSGFAQRDISDLVIRKRSLDARGRRPSYVLQIDVYKGESAQGQPRYCDQLKDVSNSEEIHIVGAGPAGYFAALELIKLGKKPIVYDRGKDVRERRRDLKAIQQDGVVNPNSNYCFGEGGAGTYSDGKLYTRSKKRGNIIDILRILVEHGAKQDILIDAHPHIGSNKLPGIISNIRKTIEEKGGQVIFDHKLDDVEIDSDSIKSLTFNTDVKVACSKVILATGHSARDVFKLLHQKEILIEAKPFALGVRVEHPQALIDEIQYGQKERSEHLPAAKYALSGQVDKKGVFSFCMCPGGLVVPSATSPGEIVVNGMSLSRRDSPFANSGIVTSIELEELSNQGYKGVFASMDFQTKIEQEVFKHGDGSQRAPAQRLTDYLEGKVSSTLGKSSYIPGLISSDINQILPPFVSHRLRHGFKQFGKKIIPYLTNEAQVIAVESRTSSPIRIPRIDGSLHHPQMINLYPCGEGPGFAGGILSAAMDGIRVAKAICV